MLGDWQLIEFEFEYFEWDQEKYASNWQKHGVWFDHATEIFEGPVVAQIQDWHDEERWLAIGISGRAILVVVFAESSKHFDICRIISARKATQAEQRWYRSHLQRQS